mmetsp:Transcript_28708/g.43798  ORF Transcript_28708/g.43798 Transcript_28708/m.43798 type:complete len:105 (+) Transcript_28708:199-513(+)
MDSNLDVRVDCEEVICHCCQNPACSQYAMPSSTPTTSFPPTISIMPSASPSLSPKPSVSQTPSLMPTKPCGNDHSSCEYWANKGECEINPGYMLESCKKTCGTC